MKNKKYLTTLKTLFDPLSKEWEETSFEEKRKEIQKKFQKEKVQDMALDHYISGFSIYTSKDKPIEVEEWGSKYQTELNRMWETKDFIKLPELD